MTGQLRFKSTLNEAFLHVHRRQPLLCLLVPSCQREPQRCMGEPFLAIFSYGSEIAVVWWLCSIQTPTPCKTTNNYVSDVCS